MKSREGGFPKNNKKIQAMPWNEHQCKIMGNPLFWTLPIKLKQQGSVLLYIEIFTLYFEPLFMTGKRESKNINCFALGVNYFALSFL